MSLKFTPSGDYAGARIVARAGRVAVGVIFPPHKGTGWLWSMWVETRPNARQTGTSRSEIAARNAIETAWADFLRAANLAERDADAATEHAP